MPQVFHPSMNTISRVTIFGAVLIVAGLLAVVFTIVRSPYITEVNVVREQPVPFSHQHHVGDVGLDCRYCHTSVEDSSFAGIPPTATCMNCHSQLFADSEMLEPVRESYRTGTPLEWTRVSDVPDFVYFNHSVHVRKGVACVTCHGDVAKMPLMWREHTLFMQWCLDCHWHPEQYVGSPQAVFASGSSGDRQRVAEDLSAVVEVESQTSCYTCHR
ncbi:MAG: cytochrome C [Planctomycetota bacterium]|nr:MAG: cytochrome C [Planctomycetota bacterium]